MSKKDNSPDSQDSQTQKAEELQDISKPAAGTRWGVTFPTRLKKAGPGSLLDPETNIRFTEHSSVLIEKAPREGSWLDCQLQYKTLVEGA